MQVRLLWIILGNEPTKEFFKSLVVDEGHKYFCSLNTTMDHSPNQVETKHECVVNYMMEFQPKGLLEKQQEAIKIYVYIVSHDLLDEERKLVVMPLSLDELSRSQIR